MLCGLLLLLTPANLTIDLGPAQAKQVIKQLSDQVGEKLVCSPELAGEILMVHATDVSWEDLKTRLARVTVDQWRKRGDEWVEYDAALARRAEQERKIKQQTIPPSPDR